MAFRIVAHEFGEDADLAGGAVVDHRPIEPRNDDVRVPEACAVDGEHGWGIERSELLAVRNEALVPSCLEPIGQHVDVGAFGRGEHRPGQVELHAVIVALPAFRHRDQVPPPGLEYDRRHG